MMPYMILPLLLISIFMAWRYSKIEIDPDWALFNMAAFTGSWYGRDFVDVKTPAIHIYYWLIAKMVGKSVPRVLFTHHFLMGICGIPYYLMTGNFWGALAFCVLINTGWLLTFHGNVGQQPATLILFALIIPNPWIACGLFVAAILFEPKLLLSFIAVVIFKGWYLPTAVMSIMGVVAILLIRWWKPQIWKWIWESSVLLPKKLQEKRKEGMYLHKWMPWFTAGGLVYLLPWLGAAIYSNQSWQFWVAPLLYVVFICYGRVIRPNHLIPLIPWVVLAGIPPTLIGLLILTDWISSGMYFGDIWQRFYLGLMVANIEAKELGEWLRDKPGDLWVNHYHTAIYIWAQKPVLYSMTEQAEIREFTDRRREMLRRWKNNPATWVIDSPQHGLNFNGAGYALVAKNNTGTMLYQKVKQ
jgi:hypothetical protein